METGSSQAESWTATTTATSHAWIRRAVPAGSFVWAGLLPWLGLLLLALFALLPFAHGDIEATVRQRTTEQLKSAGLDWVHTEVSGQDVDLSGTPPAAAAGSEAVRVATDATCPTWAGPQRCAVRVTSHFGAVAAPQEAAVAAARSCERDLAAIVAQSKIEFATDSAAITPESATVLDRLAAVARGCAGTLTVAGHTDASGQPEHNRSLSLARAGAVRDALVARGLAADRMRVEGHGADQPVATNEDEAGRALNRRIEFHVQAESGH